MAEHRRSAGNRTDRSIEERLDALSTSQRQAALRSLLAHPMLVHADPRPINLLWFAVMPIGFASG